MDADRAPESSEAERSAQMGDSSELRAKGRAIRVRLQGIEFVTTQRAREDPLWQEFQDLVDTMYGSTWAREELSQRERSLITVAALAVGTHGPELRRHLMGAQRNGITNSELKELALQLALYCGLPVTVGLWREIDALDDDAKQR
jgi:4-carboxymuconolactone decarboxylase